MYLHAMRYNPIPYLDNYINSFDRTHRIPFGRSSAPMPAMRDIERMEDAFMSLFFPGHAGVRDKKDLSQIVSFHLESATNILYDAIFLSIDYDDLNGDTKSHEHFAREVVNKLCERLPEIRNLLKLDAQAGFDGDPAATGMHEIILCYPALRAIATHRIANFLYNEGVPLVPRMMNEVVHSRTGIDIHPGATIGKSFFIDHGTGVVIGETTIIGDNVKIYQGVTLGALSFPKNGCGMLLRDTKRHPTVGNNVTIYANATILGDITIGEGSTIASNAWIKDNIPANSRVLTAPPEIIIKQKLPEDKR